MWGRSGGRGGEGAGRLAPAVAAAGAASPSRLTNVISPNGAAGLHFPAFQVNVVPCRANYGCCKSETSTFRELLGRIGISIKRMRLSPSSCAT